LSTISEKDAILIPEELLQWDGKNRKPVMVLDIKEWYDEKRRYELIEKLHQENLQFPKSSANRIDVILNNKRFIFSQGQAVINLMVWYPLFAENYIITEDFIVPKKIKDGSIADVCYLIDDELMYRGKLPAAKLSEHYSVAVGGRGLSRICYEYGPIRGNSFGFYDLAKFMKRCPEARDLMNTSYEGKGMTSGAIEKDTIMRWERLKQLLIEDGNALGQWLSVGGCISDSQAAQVFINIGFVSDMSSTIEDICIDTSYLNGIKLPSHYYLESYKGRKAALNNKDKLPGSGYLDKKLMFSSQYDIDHSCEDCGTTNFLRVKVKSMKMLRKLRWRYLKDGTVIDKLDKKLIGKWIEIRSPATCAHGDGCCLKCYGLSAIVQEGFMGGKVGSKGFSASTSQKFLSTKHFAVTKTMAIDTKIYEKYQDFVTLTKTNLLYNPKVKCKRIGFVEYEIEGVEEISMATDSGGSDSYSTLRPTMLYLEDSKGNIQELELVIEGGFFELSNELRDHIIRNSTASSTEDGVLWYPLNKMKKGTSLMALNPVNSEINKHFNDLLKKIDQNRNYITAVNSIDELFELFSDFVENVSIDIMLVHVEMIIANLIRDKANNSMPLDKSKPIKEGEYAMLGVSNSIRTSPSAATMLLFENQRAQMIKSSSYIKKSPGPNDGLLIHEHT
jgi:hypothetical protein